MHSCFENKVRISSTKLVLSIYTMDFEDNFTRLLFEFSFFYVFHSRSRFYKFALTATLSLINIILFIKSEYLFTEFDNILMVQVFLLFSLTISLLWITEGLRWLKNILFDSKKSGRYHRFFNIVLMIFQIYILHVTICQALKGISKVSEGRMQLENCFMLDGNVEL
ncbi:uncharacterized protein LOC111620194 [Centruroides sculpturatus]|uniref:uncharacterized protein LOC111620194 n=1 Tax=Centruroides sculpturatus TaxID=218467 RepID=UPI000C6E4AEA|nr:uncharacterized protein LOC111620194 [Centruroides sculpturatus]